MRQQIIYKIFQISALRGERRKEGIAVQVERLNDNCNASMSLDDYFGMAQFAQFGLALGGQIYESERTSTGKVIAETVIGCTLVGGFLGLFAVNMTNRLSERQQQEESSYSFEYEKSKALIEDLHRQYYPTIKV